MNLKDRPRLGRGLKALISNPITVEPETAQPMLGPTLVAPPASRSGSSAHAPVIPTAAVIGRISPAPAQPPKHPEPARPALKLTPAPVEPAPTLAKPTSPIAKTVTPSIKAPTKTTPSATAQVEKDASPLPARMVAFTKESAKPAPPAATNQMPKPIENPKSAGGDPAKPESPTLISDRLADIPITLIDPNPHQPRGKMDPQALQELAASIKRSGILQPVIVRKHTTHAGVRYQLVAGHRRTEAAKIAGLLTVPALLRNDSTDQEQHEWALIENIQRQDLNPIERAKAYRSYIDQCRLTHGQAADRLGEDRATISNFLRLLDLNAGVQALVARGLLSAGHAKVLAGLDNHAQQDALANRAIAEGMSVRKLEETIAETPDLSATQTPTAVAAHTRNLVAKSAHVVELEQELSRKLGTKLRIFPSKRKNTGKIVIQYFSLDEFDRIVEKFH